MDSTALQSLLDSSSTGDASLVPSVNFNLDFIKPYVIALMVLSILLTILFIINVITHIRVNRAILDIRKIVTEMNERQKGGPNTQTAPVEADAVTPSTAADSSGDGPASTEELRSSGLGDDSTVSSS